RGAARRPQRQPESAGGPWLGCLHRQSDRAAGLGARGGPRAEGHVDHYVFISTISVYAANDKPADETATLVTYKGDDPMAETIKSLNATPRLYGALKALSETEARMQYGDAATTIIRPGLIVGPRDETDRFTYWPVRLARGSEILAPGDGSDPV